MIKWSFACGPHKESKAVTAAERDWNLEIGASEFWDAASVLINVFFLFVFQGGDAKSLLIVKRQIQPERLQLLSHMSKPLTHTVWSSVQNETKAKRLQTLQHAAATVFTKKWKFDYSPPISALLLLFRTSRVLKVLLMTHDTVNVLILPYLRLI